MLTGGVFELFISMPAENVGARKRHPFTSCSKHNVVQAELPGVALTANQARGHQKSQSHHTGWPVNLRMYIKESKVED